MIKKLFSILSYLVGMAIIFGLIFFLSEREKIKNQFISYLSNQLETQTDWHVDFQNVKFRFPFHLAAEKVTLSNQGLQIQISKLALRPNLWEILNHNIVFDYVKAAQVLFLPDDQIVPINKEHDSLRQNSEMGIGFKVKHLVIQQFSIDHDLLMAHEMEHPILASPIKIVGSAAYDPVFNNFLLELALSQGDAAPLKLTTLISKKIENWHSHLRIFLPYGNMLEQYTPINGYDYETTITAQLSPTFDRITGEAHLNYDVAELINPLLGISGALHTEFEMDDKNIKFSNTKGLIGPFILDGFGYFENRELNVLYNLILYDQNWLEKCSSCSLHDATASLKLSGPLTDLVADFDAKIGNFAFKDQHFDNLCLKGSLYGSAHGIKGLLDTKCMHKAKKIQFKADIESDIVNKLELNNLLLTSDFTQASGQITYLLNDNLILGTLEGSSDLFHLNSFLQQKLLGPFSLQAKFYSGQNNKQSVDISFNANSVRGESWNAENIASTMTLNSIWDQPTGSLLINCYHFATSGQKVVHVTFDTAFDWNTKEWPFLLSCEHVEGSKFEVNSRGAWHFNQEHLKIFIEKLDGFWEDLPYTLQDAVTIEVGPKLLKITPFFFTLENGKLYALCDIDKDQIHTLIRAENLPIKIPKSLGSHLEVRGLLDTEISLSTTPTEILGEAQINLKEIIVPGLTTPQPLQMYVSANLVENRLVCNGKLRGFGQNPIQLSGQFPLNISLEPLSIDLDKDQDLSANLHMEGRIEPLLEFFLPFGSTHVSGDMNMVCSVIGRWPEPKITGKGEFTDLTYELLGLGTAVRKGKAQVDFDGHRLNLIRLEAFSSEGKPIYGKGSALLDAKENFPFDLFLNVNSLPISPMENFYGTVSGNLHLKGDAAGALLEGKISTTSLNVTVPEKTAEIMHAIDVTYVNQPKGKPLPTQFNRTTSSWPFNLNLDITIPDNGHVQGADWKTLWKGHLFMTGTPDNPLFSGSLHLINGEYRFNGKPFSIDQGTITFGGDFEKKTSLYVIASRDLDTIRAEVIVKGPVSKPAITFRSNPPLPQREILSWILFNRGTAEISAFQGSQLNESITDLASGNRQPDMLTKIRDRFGVDRIDISRENGMSNDMSLQVGKYLSKGFLVSVNRSITAETNRLAIEANITKQFKVQAEVGDDSDAHLLLKWKKDY